MIRKNEIEKEIAEARALLRALYKKKKELGAAIRARKPRRITCEQRMEQVYAMVLTGLSIDEIAIQIGLTKPTVEQRLNSKLYHLADQELPKEHTRLELNAKIVELNSRLPEAGRFRWKDGNAMFRRDWWKNHLASIKQATPTEPGGR
jgi:DNA-binding transcriptional ArsR family regulator